MIRPTSSGRKTGTPAISDEHFTAIVVLMNGRMMQMPLLVSSLLDHAARHHSNTEIVSRRVEGDIHRMNYAQLAQRARQVANALDALGCASDARIATLAWNGYRHLEL
jgi:3-(methylthio)propionyl---CoA ligase